MSNLIKIPNIAQKLNDDMHGRKVNDIARDSKIWSHEIIVWTFQQGIKITKWHFEIACLLVICIIKHR